MGWGESRSLIESEGDSKIIMTEGHPFFILSNKKKPFLDKMEV